MNRFECGARRLFSSAALTAACTLLGTAAAWAERGPLGAQLAGAWTLVSIEVTAKDGSKRPGFGGPQAQGILILDASGRYAQVTGRPDRPKLKTTVRPDIPAAELGEAARSFGAVFGTWTANEGDKMLIQKAQLASIPNGDGGETKSSVSLAADELRLVVARRAGGTTLLVYRRAK